MVGLKIWTSFILQLTIIFTTTRASSSSSSASTLVKYGYYTFEPLPVLGAHVFDVDLTIDPSPEMIQQFLKDLHEHKLLVFKNQKEITAARQRNIGLWFGKTLDGKHKQHAKDEDRFVFRLSNNESEGHKGVGNHGWHIDGSHYARPHAYVLYYMVSVPQKGNSLFVDLSKVLNRVTEKKRAKWDRLHYRPRPRKSLVHPLVYTHPVTGDQTLVINPSYMDHMIENYNTPTERILNATEQRAIMDELYDAIHKEYYTHKWEEGDLLLSDNRALAHMADEDSSRPPEEIGLRILHRVCVNSDNHPSKDPLPGKHSPRGVKTSTHVDDSSHVENSTGVENSSHVHNSTVVENSTHMTNSTHVQNSTHVNDSLLNDAHRVKDSSRSEKSDRAGESQFTNGSATLKDPLRPKQDRIEDEL